MQLLGSAQVAAEKADRLPSSLLITAQSVLDQRDGHIAGPTFGLITKAADGHQVSSRWRSTISSGTLSRLAIGVEPGDWYSQALYQPVRDDDGLWKGLQKGQVGLSQIAASRLRATTGTTVELPTVHGPKEFQVAGIFTPRMVDDTAVGDIVLASQGVARSEWAAVRDHVAVQYLSPDAATAHRGDFTGLDAGLSVYDNAQWHSVASAGITRFLKPFTIAGYVVMAAAGLSVLNVFILGLLQRKRERAVLRAIGVTRRQEQAVIIAQAALLGLLVAVCGTLGGIGMTYLWSLGSPVYYGIKVEWAALGLPLLTAVTALMVSVLAAAAYPVIYTRKLETIDVLRTG
ncbi:ABC transporter permease [Mycolicibacterium porcinum]|uniref:ABC transporter permease n=1 Tax=Mycolicibacterium porcinum TaxID=39693 RepID=UPI00084948BE|nr:ABC transporter permease [Mycolicibacterium porcinum]ODR27225.1 hypothetical protein BHQ19_02970 [Mycolicibacterium porcinum]